MSTPRTVIIYSGGLDSTALLYYYLNLGHHVRALSVNYGQRHVKELEAAAEICQLNGVEHQVADLTSITKLLGTSSQTNPDIEVPEGHYAAENMKLTVVPNRNMIMLSLAIGWAVATKSDFVAFAAHAGDHTIYPDCRDEFAEAVNQCAKLCDWHQVEIQRPFVKWSKADIVAWGVRNEVPFERTWTCYKGGGEHCGRCATCVERIEAFQLAHAPDPTVYTDMTFWKDIVGQLDSAPMAAQEARAE